MEPESNNTTKVFVEIEIPNDNISKVGPLYIIETINNQWRSHLEEFFLDEFGASLNSIAIRPYESMPLSELCDEMMQRPLSEFLDGVTDAFLNGMALLTSIRTAKGDISGDQ